MPTLLSARAFTLVEVIVTIVISSILLGGISMLFMQIGETLTISRDIDQDFESVKTFRSDYEMTRGVSTDFYTHSTGSVFSSTLYGYQATVFANPSHTIGAIVGAWDSTTGHVATYSTGTYDRRYPFIMIVGSGALASVSTDTYGYLASVTSTSTGIKLYPDIPLFRIVYTPLNSDLNKGKLDIGFFSTYHPEWANMRISDLIANQVVDKYFFSIVY